MSALDRLRRLVELESPSDDEVRLRAVAGAVAGDLARLGFEVDTRDVAGVGEHVVGRWAGRRPEEDPVLVLAHLDTVHPVGTFDPVFTVRDGRAYGPGVVDMKGGLACMLEALAQLRAGEGPRRPVTLLATCDEETGSASSRGLIEELAGRAAAVLVPEPSFPDGGAKTRRKGVAVYRLHVDGQPAHTGLAPAEGVNALVELAHQILDITALSDLEAGTWLSVSMAQAGTASNVVPGRAWAEVDVRFVTQSEGERVDAAMRALTPHDQAASLRLTGGINRPPMERTKGVAALYERARSVAEADGWELGEGLSGGASDGSYTAGLGVPTLDGIGPVGGGVHTPGEYVLVDDLPRRVSLYRGLLETL